MKDYCLFVIDPLSDGQIDPDAFDVFIFHASVKTTLEANTFKLGYLGRVLTFYLMWPS